MSARSTGGLWEMLAALMAVAIEKNPSQFSKKIIIMVLIGSEQQDPIRYIVR